MIRPTFRGLARLALAAAATSSLALAASVPAQAATSTQAAPVRVAAADQYVALGDSYSSGNGTFAANLDWFCCRASDSVAGQLSQS
ncbi:MAG: hypothetical protein ACRDT6_11950 [Micromonosporaceae bacterium]